MGSKSIVTLWPHQQQALDFLAAHPRAFLWHEPRLGKTRTILTELAQLKPRRALIVCPKTVAAVWEQETNVLYIVNLTDGPIPNRTLPDQGIVLVNYDALQPMVEQLIRWRPQYVCADEIHLAKSAGARRSRALHRICAVSNYARGLSGTPTPQSYKDLYAQFRAIAPEIFGTRLAAFLERYCILHPKWPSKVIGYRHLDELRSKAFSIAHRVSRDQALGVPPMQEITRRVNLPDAARKIYDTLAQTYTIENLDASHALTRSLRLAQITAGILPDDCGEERWLHDAKVDAVIGELSEPLSAGEKGVVFYRFKQEGRKICAALQKAHGPSAAMLLSGETPQGQRTNCIIDFNTAEYPKVLVCQEQLGLGVSFRRANLAVFASSSFDYATFTQCKDRIYAGPGQAKTFVYLVCPRTIDVTIREALAKKKSLSDYLLDIGFGEAARGELLETRAV